MIVAERKPFAEILANARGADKVLLVGCNTCVAICLAGGEKEVAVTAAQLRLALRGEGRALRITERCVERQCEPEFNEDLGEAIAAHDVVLSMACGQACRPWRSSFPGHRHPALNTTFGPAGARGRALLGCGIACGQVRWCVPITPVLQNLLNGLVDRPMGAVSTLRHSLCVAARL